MTNVHRLRTTDRIFFIVSNLRLQRHPFEDSELDLLIEVFKIVRARLEFLLCGYVLMPDHWHALIWPPFPLSISKVLQELKKLATYRINHFRGIRGALWQHQFWDRFVRSRREFNERLEYMHFNPVRKGLVEKPEEWRWSSYNNFSLDKEVVAACPIQIDYVDLSDDYRA